jgi:hypothetical protein
MEKDDRIRELEEENAKLRQELLSTKEHLKRYTNPPYRQEYYEKNKEAIKQRARECKPTPEQKKEYNKRAYIKRKEKLKNQPSENI